MIDEEEFPPDAPLEAYLRLAERYYRQDRLDLAMRVVNDAFANKGWQPGLWTAFYNEIVCEAEAREASPPRRVDENLSIELAPDAPPEQFRDLASAAVESRTRIGELLRVSFERPVMITVFLPDAALDFIVGTYGYVSHKTELDKICLPRVTIRSRPEVLDALLHEFMHVATHELAGDRVPHWLNEGIATYASGELDSRHVRFVIQTAAKRGKLLKLSKLEGILNSGDMRKDDPVSVQAAYYVSASFVAHWIERFGIESVHNALVKIGEGEDPDHAVSHACSISVRELEREWRETLTHRSTSC